MQLPDDVLLADSAASKHLPLTVPASQPPSAAPPSVSSSSHAAQAPLCMLPSGLANTQKPVQPPDDMLHVSPGAAQSSETVFAPPLLSSVIPGSGAPLFPVLPSALTAFQTTALDDVPPADPGPATHTHTTAASNTVSGTVAASLALSAAGLSIPLSHIVPPCPKEPVPLGADLDSTVPPPRSPRPAAPSSSEAGIPSADEAAAYCSAGFEPPVLCGRGPNTPPNSARSGMPPFSEECLLCNSRVLCRWMSHTVHWAGELQQGFSPIRATENRGKSQRSMEMGFRENHG